MDFLTEEELYELEHQDELDILNDMEPMDSYENEEFDPTSFGPKKQLMSKKTNINSRSENDKNSSSKVESHGVFQNGNSSKSTSFSHHSEEHDSFEGEVEKTAIDHISENLSKSSKRNIPEDDNSASDSAEISGKLPAKRKLLYASENQTSKRDTLSDFEIGEFSGGLISQTEKRKASCVFGDDSEIENTVKKSRANPQSPTEVLSSEKPHPQVRSSSYNNYSSFLTETLPLTRSDGRRIYFGIKDEDAEDKKILSFSQRTSSLLPTPIDTLKSQYFIREEQFLKEQESIRAEGGSVLPEIEEMDENKENSLWVEKYRPVSYMHLLSEEGINRTLLQWLKLWDKVVFGKEKKVKKKPAENKKENTFKKTWGEQLVEDLDEHGRPYHKIAFLSGPPGLGKTTLATIIAKHAGYNVIELNASDDRNPDAFRTSLEAATQMKSVLHQDKRPNCLILDEIDGAPAASINVLLSFIKSTGFPKGGKRKKGDIPLLTRPLICICNDQYSVALKPLRQLALVLNFPTTAASRLASRLHEVSSKEGLVADMAALTLLCEKTCNDIRSCLSTLQFIHRQKNDLKVSDLESLQIGQKDMQKSLFAVWQDVFYFKEKKSFSNILNIIQAYGDYEKIYVGMFENYLSIKFKHKTLDAVWQGAEWSCFGDIIQQQIAQKQLFFLMPYLPYPAVAFHMLFASNAYSQISYPTAFYEHKAKASQLSSTLTSVIKDMISSLKTFLNPGILLVDVFPFLTEIIKPNLRPVNTQLYSDLEKKELLRVIELMLAFNLNYHQERSLDGTYNYVLDPNIEELIKFSDMKTRKMLTYSAKQMIAREVEVERMRKGDSSADQKAVKLSSSESTKKLVENITKLPEPKIFQKRKQIIAERPVLDFFGRKVVQTAKMKDADKKDSRDEEVWFHFKEGYSNAVRKPVYIKDLL